MRGDGCIVELRRDSFACGSELSSNVAYHNRFELHGAASGSYCGVAIASRDFCSIFRRFFVMVFEVIVLQVMVAMGLWIFLWSGVEGDRRGEW